MSERHCQVCGGQRLKPVVLAVTIEDKSIAEFTSMSIGESLDFLDKIDENLDERSRKIGEEILKEIKNRITFLNDVGLDYLTLDRSAGTLSGR